MAKPAVNCIRCGREYGIQTGQNAQDAAKAHAEACNALLDLDRLVNGRSTTTDFRSFDEDHPLRA